MSQKAQTTGKAKKSNKAPIRREQLRISDLMSDKLSGESDKYQLSKDNLRGIVSYMSELEQELEETKKLVTSLKKEKDQAIAKAKKVKQEFLENMSHEIRTPMNSVYGFSTLLEAHNLDPEAKSFSRIIRSSAEDLLLIFGDILDYSEIEAGKLTLEKSQFSLTKTLTELKKRYEQKASEKGITFSIRQESHLPDQLIGDRIRLKQILKNLLSNAIKFTDTGHVELTIKVLSQGPDKHLFEFAVTDSGIGISKENKAFIFDSFSQVDSNLKRKFHGTGLGLTITKQLVTLMDGSISVVSEPGKGSTFMTLIPFEMGNAASYNPEPVDSFEPTQLLGTKVLLVEDNRNNQVYGKKVLSQAGMTVEVAVNGKVALSKLEKGSYDIILMDVQMPEMDGIETTRHIRKRTDKKARLPIIALTAHATAAQAKQYLRAGMDRFVSKPYAPEVLYRTIWSLLHRGENNSEEVEEMPRVIQEVPDLSGLKKLARGENNFLIEMIQIFLEDIPRYLRLIRTCAAAGDWKEMADMAHKIKAPLELMGVNALNPNLDYLEYFDPNKTDVASVEEHLETIEESCLNSMTILKEELKELQK